MHACYHCNMQLGRYTKLSRHTGKDVHPWVETPDTDAVLVLGRNDNLIERVVLDAKELLFIDTRGLSQSILGYIKPSKIKDTIYFNPADREFPLAFNPLSYGDEDTALHILEIFRALFGSSWGPQLEMILRHSLLLALTAPNPSFLSAYFILTSETYRKRLKIDDPYITEFWRDFATWDDRQKIERTQSTLNKLDAFLFHTGTRNILTQKNKLEFTNKVVLVDLSGTPKDLACLLGSLLIQHTSARVVVTDAEMFKIPDRAGRLVEYRAYPDIAFDTLMVFRPLGKDMKSVAEELNVLPQDIIRLGENCAWLKTPTVLTTHVHSEAHSRKFYGSKDKIIDQTRRKYCAPRAVVAEQIALMIKSVAAVRPVSSGGFKRKKR